MGLFNRISDILSANLNDLIDQYEDPEKMLKQAIREMEAALGRTMDGAARMIAHQRILSRQVEEQRRLVERCRESAEASVRRGDDQVARQQLRRKSEHEKLANALAEQAETAKKQSDRLRTQVSSMRLKLAQARNRMWDLNARNRAAEARRAFAVTLHQSHYAEPALSDFERISERIERSHAESEALWDLLDDDETSEPVNDDVEAELQAMKEAHHHVAD